jgi:hypothetical protein
LKYSKEISTFFRFDSYDREMLMIASALHDIGYLKGRDEHANNGADLAKEYLKSLNLLNDSEVDRIAKAISNHGGKLESDYKDDISFALVLADKMDFTKTRYNKDINKYPKVEPFLNINEVRLEKKDGSNYLVVEMNESYVDNESSNNYFLKLENVLSKVESVRGETIIIQKVYS